VRNRHNGARSIGFNGGMKTNDVLVPKPGNQLWGIYHTDREYARLVGDPLRTVVEAPTKLAAEDAALRLGFGDPWAHPVTPEEARQAQWLPARRVNERRPSTRRPARGVRV